MEVMDMTPIVDGVGGKGAMYTDKRKLYMIVSHYFQLY